LKGVAVILKNPQALLAIINISEMTKNAELQVENCACIRAYCCLKSRQILETGASKIL